MIIRPVSGLANVPATQAQSSAQAVRNHLVLMKAEMEVMRTKWFQVFQDTGGKMDTVKGTEKTNMAQEAKMVSRVFLGWVAEVVQMVVHQDNILSRRH